MNKLIAIFCILWGSGIALAAHGQSLDSAAQFPPLETLDTDPASQIGEGDVLPPFADALPEPNGFDPNDEFFDVPGLNDRVEPIRPTAEELRQQAERLSERAMPPVRESAYPGGPVGQDRYRLQQQMRDLSLYKRQQQTDQGDRVPGWIDSPDTAPWSAEPVSPY